MLRRIAASLAAMRRAIEVPTLLDVQNPTVAAPRPAAQTRTVASLAAMRHAIELAVPTSVILAPRRATQLAAPTGSVLARRATVSQLPAALTPAARALTATPSGRGPPVGQIALVATTAAAPSAAIQVAEAPRPAHARALTVRMAAILQRASTIAPEPAVAMAPHAAAPRMMPTQKASAFKRFCPAQGSPRVAR